MEFLVREKRGTGKILELIPIEYTLPRAQRAQSVPRAVATGFSHYNRVAQDGEEPVATAPGTVLCAFVVFSP